MSVRKRGNCYQVQYRCPGEKNPRTESFKTEEEAIIRDKQIALAKKKGNFTPPPKQSKGVIKHQKEVTVKAFLEEYVEMYGLKKWGDSYYTACMGLINNYINPQIGDRYVRSLDVRDIDEYYTSLLDIPAVVVTGHMDTGATVSAHTVGRIHKLLKSAFAKAKVWGYTDINPTIGATLPEYRSQKRAVWSDVEALAALNACNTPILRICLYLAIGCSLRLGEILGLQWEQVHITDADIARGEAHIKIDRELKRCSNKSLDQLERVNRSSIIFKFPLVIPKKAKTTLVLKAPKTESSNRIVYLPMTVIEELKSAQTQQNEYKKMLGEEYLDYDLVVAQINGRPYEQKTIDKMFASFIENNHLRPVVFHSLRHCSTSLKLKISRGNVKAVQGDTGHAEARMVTDTYAHTFDSDRKTIAQEMDAAFFSKVGENTTEEKDPFLVEKIKVLLKQNPSLLQAILEEDTEQS